MFVTAVCLLFLLKLKWPKNKSVYELHLTYLIRNNNAVTGYSWQQSWKKTNISNFIHEMSLSKRGTSMKSLKWVRKWFINKQLHYFLEIPIAGGNQNSSMWAKITCCGFLKCLCKMSTLFSRGQPLSRKNLVLPPGEGTPWNFWWGCAARISKSRPDFRPKNAIFHTRFQTWPQKSIPVFRPDLVRD